VTVFFILLSRIPAASVPDRLSFRGRAVRFFVGARGGSSGDIGEEAPGNGMAA